VSCFQLSGPAPTSISPDWQYAGWRRRTVVGDGYGRVYERAAMSSARKHPTVLRILPPNPRLLQSEGIAAGVEVKDANPAEAFAWLP